MLVQMVMQDCFINSQAGISMAFNVLYLWETHCCDGQVSSFLTSDNGQAKHASKEMQSYLSGQTQYIVS